MKEGYYLFFGGNNSEDSLEELIESMKPVPYESIKDKLPTEFANTMRQILKD